MSELSPKDIENIRTDISIAEGILYPKGDIKDQNAYLINQSAYHSQQAIEKSLKALIRAYGDVKDNDSLRTHNVSDLLVQAETCRPHFIQNHTFLAENKTALTALNSLRYVETKIGKKDAYVLFKEANKLFKELEQECLKNYPDKEVYNKVAYMQYGEQKNLSLNTDHSEFAHGKNKHKRGETIGQG